MSISGRTSKAKEPKHSNTSLWYNLALMKRIWKIGLAVSGGADSTALAVLMAGLRKDYGFKAVVLHVDHGIRPDSGEDATFVKRLARQLEMPFHGTRVTVARRRGESLEMAARRERLAFFARMTKRLKLDAIATGHHADDVAETFLMRLARGSGAEGLAGLKRISRVDGITFMRPLLDMRDSELKDFLRRNNIPWREDSTNTDISILRNKVRHVVLPWLKENFDPRMTEHLCKSAAILRGDLHLPKADKADKGVKDDKGSKGSKAFTLEIAADAGFSREAQAIGKLPAIAYLSRKALAGRRLEVRPWQAGDRISPTGMNGKSRKLQDVFVTAKTPQELRRTLPVLADAVTGEILWVPGYRVAQSVAVESPTAPSWRMTLR